LGSVGGQVTRQALEIDRYGGESDLKADVGRLLLAQSGGANRVVRAGFHWESVLADSRRSFLV